MEWTCHDKKSNSYILRYYLPCEPVCDAEVTSRRAKDLLRYCRENKIEAVMLYVDLHPYWYYAPDNIEHSKYYVEVLKPLIAKLREANVSYQLNYQNLIGSWDGGADLDYINQWENYVDYLGKESTCCACCCGEKFREIGGTKLKMWAETKPDALWIDDDIRIHNHRTSIRDYWAGRISAERPDYGCFCDNHMKQFNDKYKMHVTRKELVDGMLDGNSDYRKKWFDFASEMAVDTVEWIEKTVHSVSPDTKIAVMTSTPDVHRTEGRDWNKFLRGLSGDKRPLIRPTLGPYPESGPFQFFTAYHRLEQLKTNIKSQFGSLEFDFCPEIENTRFTRWSKSLAGTAYQINLTSFLGCRGMTLSIYDLEGCILDEEPEFADMLNNLRPFANKMAQEDMWYMESMGIGIVTAPARLTESFEGKKLTQYSQFATGRMWEEALLKAGIPCRYITPEEVGGCKCVALDNYTANMLTDAELEIAFSKGVILNAGAAKILCDRGFGKYIGVEVGETANCISASEILNNVTRSDGSVVRIPSRIDGGKWNNLTLKGAEQITRLVTPYGTEFTGIACFKNSLGGTVYTFAHNTSFGDGFYSNYRIELLKEICKEVAGEEMITVNNRAYAMTAVKKDNNVYHVFVGNLWADPQHGYTIEMPFNVNEAVWIDMDGNEHSAKVNGNTVICDDVNLGIYDCFVCRIS